MSPFAFIPLVSSAFCAVVGQVRRRHLPPVFHLFTLQAWAAVFVELAAHSYRYYQQDGNNHIVYNIYMPFDFVLQFLAGGRLVQGKSWFPNWLGCAVYFLVWILSLMVQGVNTMANFSIICGAIILAVRYIQVLIVNARQPSGPLATGIYFIAVSILLYNCCMIPLFSLMHYLIREDLIMAGEIFQLNVLLCILKYIGTGLGLLIVSRALQFNKEEHV